MSSSLAQKLQINPGQRMVVVNAPQGYLEKLAKDMGDIIITTEAAPQIDAMLIFLTRLSEAVPFTTQAIHPLKPDSPLWLAYPKGASKIKTDVNRDRLWKAIEPTRWRPVRMVAIDETWSAMRLRPAEPGK